MTAHLHSTGIIPPTRFSRESWIWRLLPDSLDIQGYIHTQCTHALSCSRFSVSRGQLGWFENKSRGETGMPDPSLGTRPLPLELHAVSRHPALLKNVS